MYRTLSYWHYSTGKTVTVTRATGPADQTRREYARPTDASLARISNLMRRNRQQVDVDLQVFPSLVLVLPK